MLLYILYFGHTVGLYLIHIYPFWSKIFLDGRLLEVKQINETSYHFACKFHRAMAVVPGKSRINGS